VFQTKVSGGPVRRYSNTRTTGASTQDPDECDGRQTRVHQQITELSNSLESWRRNLPQDLHWNDKDRLAQLGLPGTSFRGMQTYVNPLNDIRPFEIAATSQVAWLRSWYYYARHMTYRPFVHKALHAPESMTPQDCLLAANCLQDALLWPIAMAPCADMKRVFPGSFNWTYCFVEVLLMFRMIRESEMLASINDQYLDAGELRQTVFALLDWVRDMSQIDGLAGWASGLMEKLYPEVHQIRFSSTAVPTHGALWGAPETL
jgi:hypothetical protein